MPFLNSLIIRFYQFQSRRRVPKTSQDIGYLSDGPRPNRLGLPTNYTEYELNYAGSAAAAPVDLDRIVTWAQTEQLRIIDRFIAAHGMMERAHKLPCNAKSDAVNVECFEEGAAAPAAETVFPACGGLGAA